MRAVPTATLDQILSLQLLVAWAGERSRLGWWNTHLIDPDGGLDFLQRLAPRTSALAAWELVRAAAVSVDTSRRALQADGDRMLTLFHLGVDVDEALADRLHELKLSGGQIPGLPAPDGPFDRAALATRLQALGAVDTDTRAAGRKIKGDLPVGPEVRVKRLAAAMVPFPNHYPMPYFGPSA